MTQLTKYKRNINYVNKDFSEFRTALINYAKNYFPNTFQDFNESSPQMGFIEMCAYVGDVLGFYADVNLQESLLSAADERINLYNLAQGMGYKAKTVVPSSVELDVFQLVPSIGEGQDTQPDFRYALYINENMIVSTSDTNATYFYTKDALDFRYSSSYDPTTVTVYTVLDDGSIEYYLLKKKVRAVSGELKVKNFQFGNPKIYDKIVIEENDVTEIVKVTDSDNNLWYEVPYLAQDLVPTTIRNTSYYDQHLAQYKTSAPYILTFKQTERRFVTRLRKDDNLEIQFGSGMSSEADEEIVPSPMNVGLGLDYFERVGDVSIDPMNFLYTKTYGTAPTNTVLAIQYANANGLADNVQSNTITRIVSSSIVDPVDTGTNSTVLQTIKDSLAINNPYPAYGGQNRKPLEVIREEAIANFASQNRAVTKEDYIFRCFSMPAKFGAIAKAYIEVDNQIGRWNQDRIPNPFAMNLYVLAYDGNKNFVNCNEVIKENLRQYLRQYRLLTDAINIKDPYVIDLGVQYEIITYPNENSNEVLLKCTEKLIELFKPENMNLNAPIIISKVRTELDKVQGVQTVKNIKFINLINTNEGYAGNVYDVDTAIRNDVLYPPTDISIFQIKYPKRNIVGRISEN